MNNNQFGRSILTNSFLAKIVQMRRYFLTMCTKPLHKEKNIKQMSCSNQEKGRSMVEMLGVLAIIGVLSVGAIAGYQKAMFKYKLNKQAQQLNHIISTGLRYAGQWSNIEIDQANENMSYLSPYFIKLNEIPKEMIKENGIYDIFGINISYRYYHNSKKTSIFIFPPNNEDFYSMEICRNIVKTVKEYATDIYSFNAISGTENSYDSWMTYYGDKFCQTNCIKDLTLEKIDEFCKQNTNNTYQPHLKISYEG